MSKRSWLAVTLVIGVGILLQIPDRGGHIEHHATDGHDHGSMALGPVEGTPGQRTVVLEVTGMT